MGIRTDLRAAAVTLTSQALWLNELWPKMKLCAAEKADIVRAVAHDSVLFHLVLLLGRSPCTPDRCSVGDVASEIASTVSRVFPLYRR